MDHRNSFTSSSKAKRYLGWCLAAALAYLALAYHVSATSIRTFAIDDAAVVLLGYQRQKLAAQDTFGTVFLGDSSLGNAIDARIWEAETGRRAVNLALAGIYGYKGSLDLLQGIVSRSRPRNVVIMHTTDMISRKPVEIASLLLSSLDQGRETSMWRTRLNYYLRTDTVLHSIQGLVTGRDYLIRKFIASDYVRQTNAGGGGLETESFNGKPAPILINPHQAASLGELAELCKQQGLNCMYAHGPIYERICAPSAESLKIVNRQIESLGLRVVMETPLCVAREDLGDQVDHVHPGRREKSTKAYFELLRPYLQ